MANRGDAFSILISSTYYIVHSFKEYKHIFS